MALYCTMYGKCIVQPDLLETNTWGHLYWATAESNKYNFVFIINSRYVNQVEESNHLQPDLTTRFYFSILY